MLDIRFVVWGAGFKGKKLLKLLSGNFIAAFIDEDINKIGNSVGGIPIISYEEYKEKYNNLFIIISVTDFEEIEEYLIKEKIYRYFILSECPSEFLGYGISDLNMLLDWNVDTSKCNFIWGLNLYSVLLYKVFEEKGCMNLWCVPHKNLKKEKINEIKQLFNIRICDCADVLSYREGNLYLTTREKCCDVIDDSCRLKSIYAFDFSERVPQYYHEELRQFYNKHEGERCFIVATGPSLRIEDLEVLKRNKEKCISVNRIFNLKNSKWKPDYYLVLDHMVINRYKYEISEYDAETKFVNDCAGEFWSTNQKSNCHRIHGITDDMTDELPRFSEDITKAIYTGATVTYACIQLAAYMGFKKIILLGVDCNYVMGSNKNYFFNVAEPDNINHRENRMIESYKAARQYAETHGIQIQNATRGGMLEVFERVNFDDLFINEREAV